MPVTLREIQEVIGAHVQVDEFSGPTTGRILLRRAVITNSPDNDPTPVLVFSSGARNLTMALRPNLEHAHIVQTPGGLGHVHVREGGYTIIDYTLPISKEDSDYLANRRLL